MAEESGDVHTDGPDAAGGETQFAQDFTGDLGDDFDLGDDDYMLHVRERRIAELKKAYVSSMRISLSLHCSDSGLLCVW
jgi:hypothetical protein